MVAERTYPLTSRVIRNRTWPSLGRSTCPHRRVNRDTRICLPSGNRIDGAHRFLARQCTRHVPTGTTLAKHQVEQAAHTADGRRLVVTACWSETQTPHELRVAAEHRAEQAGKQLRTALSRSDSHDDGTEQELTTPTSNGGPVSVPVTRKRSRTSREVLPSNGY